MTSIKPAGRPLGVALIACLWTQTAYSALLVQGDIAVISPPPSVANAAFASDDTIFLFRERVGVQLDDPLMVNLIGEPGATSEGAIRDLIYPDAGRFDVYLLHFDPVGLAPTPIRRQGAVQFGGQIAGLIFTTDLLLQSDEQLGAPGVDYLGTAPRPGANRGFELPYNAQGLSVTDLAEVLADGRTVAVNFGATAFSDQLRVLVRVPEPTALALAATAALLVRTRRRNGAPPRCATRRR